MIFYRCDKCKKELTNQSLLYRIRIIAEIYDEDHWRPSRETVYFDVCYKCAKSIMDKFIDQFEKEGDVDEDIS